MNKYLVFDPSKCTGCRTCEMVCSIYNSGVGNTASSRRTVIKMEKHVINLPLSCLHCFDPICKKVCPANAFVYNSDTGCYTIDQSKCVGCKMCMIACPFAAISIEPNTNQMIKCDLCGGDPLCVRFCPNNAIDYVTADVYGIMRKKKSMEEMSNLMSSVL